VLDRDTQRTQLEAKLQGLHEKLLERKASLVDGIVRVPILEMAITDLYIRICEKLNESPDAVRCIFINKNEIDYTNLWRLN